MIYSNNTYDITTNISTYTRRDFKSVFDISSSKWYMLNNLNNYEEYGIYGSNFDTYYVGKLVIVNDHEYEWDGTEWVDLGTYVENILGWGKTVGSRHNSFSILYNGSNYILKATANDVEFDIHNIGTWTNSNNIFFILSASTGDRYEYEFFRNSGTLYYDLGYSSGYRLSTSQTFSANTDYNFKLSNGKYLNTKRSITINGSLKSSNNNLSNKDNASDRITLEHFTEDKFYYKDLIIYDTNGPLFNIQCKSENGSYVLYDSLGNGTIYSYGTTDPVVVNAYTNTVRPKSYEAKTVPTITEYAESTLFMNSHNITTLYKNEDSLAVLDYMDKNKLNKKTQMGL